MLWLRLEVATEGNGLMASLAQPWRVVIPFSQAHRRRSRRLHALPLCSISDCPPRNETGSGRLYRAHVGPRAHRLFGLGLGAPATVLTYFVSLPGAFLAFFA